MLPWMAAVRLEACSACVGGHDVEETVSPNANGFRVGNAVVLRLARDDN